MQISTMIIVESEMKNRRTSSFNAQPRNTFDPHDLLQILNNLRQKSGPLSYLRHIFPPQQCFRLRLPFLPLPIDFSTTIFLPQGTFFRRLSSFESRYSNGTLKLYPCVMLGASTFALA
jgi:hypothetical protein